MLFSSHIKCILSTGLIFDVGLDHLAEEWFVRFIHSKVTLFSLSCFDTLEEVVCLAHTSGVRSYVPPP